MIVFLVGPFCAGKSIVANDLRRIYNFQVIDLVMLYQLRDLISVDEFIQQANWIGGDPHQHEPEAAPQEDMGDPNEEEKPPAGNFPLKPQKVKLERKRDFAKEFYFLSKDQKMEFQALVDKVVQYLNNERRTRWVIYPIIDINMWSSLFSSGCLFVFKIHAKLKDRLVWHNKKYNEQLSLEEFTDLDDDLTSDRNYIRSWEWNRRINRPEPFVNNESESQLLSYFAKYFCEFKNRWRPDKDMQLMRYAHLASLRTNCCQEGVGASIANKDKYLLSTGHNGTAPNAVNWFDGGCEKCSAPDLSTDKECVCIHAEKNALGCINKFSAQQGTIFVTKFPWRRWAEEIKDYGIRKIWYYSDSDNLEDEVYIRKTLNIELERIDPFEF